jgi:alginate O-acetyltransferase complex protein AlgI
VTNFADLATSSLSETILIALVIYLVYLALGRIVIAQNILLLLVGYMVYTAIDLRHLIVLLLITGISFVVGARLPKSSRPGLLLRVSIAVLATVLLAFRYHVYVAEALGSIFVSGNPLSLESLAPLGLSFYTLQAISYLTDVRSGRLNPETNLVNFALYLSLIFKLPAGPIERPGAFLEQIRTGRQITGERINVGTALIIQGAFEKFVVADNLANVVNGVFSNPQGQGLNIPLAVMIFAFQLYTDFSGYSNIFRGLAMFFGFELTLNFKLPYFATSPNDFWARWHISLSSWLREYIFFPLRRWLVARKIGNTAAVVIPTAAAMLVSGLWHGATLNFVVWGLYWATLSVAFYYLDKRQAGKSGGLIATAGALLRITLMFILICVGWFIFRVDGWNNFVDLVSNASLQATPQTYGFIADFIFYVGPLIVFNLIQAYMHDLFVLANIKMPFRSVVWACLVVWILIFGAPASAQFIYARF